VFSSYSNPGWRPWGWRSRGASSWWSFPATPRPSRPRAPAPRTLVEGVVAEPNAVLEIGAGSLKLVELSGYPPALKALAARPLPPGTLVEGVVVEPNALSQEIRELLAEARTRKRYVVSAVPNPSVILRTLQVPKMPPKEMEEAVRWEAERYIPFPIDEVVLDFAPLDPLAEVPEGEQVEVLVAAARQEAVASLIEALRGRASFPLSWT
jgi:type IV pilus assembly protein PilM